MNARQRLIDLAWRAFKPDARGRGPLILTLVVFVALALAAVLIAWGCITFAAVAFGSAAH